MFRGIGAALIGVLVIAAIAGCGGSDDSDTGLTTSSLSKTKYIEKAAAICLKRVTERNSIFSTGYEKEADKSGNLSKAAEGKIVTEASLPRMRTLVKELEELGAPSGDEATVEAILVAIEKGNNSVEANPVGVLISRDPYAQSKKLALAYGMQNCYQI